MSGMPNKRTRCDGCGKWSASPRSNEYKRPSGAAGYMWPNNSVIDNMEDDGRDWCEECIESGAALTKINSTKDQPCPTNPK